MQGSDWFWLFIIFVPLVLEKVGYIDIFDDEGFIQETLLDPLLVSAGIGLVAPLLGKIPGLHSIWDLISWLYPDASAPFEPLMDAVFKPDWYIAPYAGFGVE